MSGEPLNDVLNQPVMNEQRRSLRAGNNPFSSEAQRLAAESCASLATPYAIRVTTGQQEEICGYEVWYSLLPQYTQGSADTLYEDVEHQLKDSFGPHDKPRIAACVYSRKKGSGSESGVYNTGMAAGLWTRPVHRKEPHEHTRQAGGRGTRGKAASMACAEGAQHTLPLSALAVCSSCMLCVSAALRINTAGPAHAQLLYITTAKAQRRRGLARLLLCALQQRLATAGGHMVMTVLLGGAHLGPLWRGMGFMPPDTQPLLLLRQAAGQEPQALRFGWDVWASALGRKMCTQGLAQAVAGVVARAVKQGKQPGSQAGQSAARQASLPAQEVTQPLTEQGKKQAYKGAGKQSMQDTMQMHTQAASAQQDGEQMLEHEHADTITEKQAGRPIALQADRQKAQNAVVAVGTVAHTPPRSRAPHECMPAPDADAESPANDRVPTQRAKRAKLMHGELMSLTSPPVLLPAAGDEAGPGAAPATMQVPSESAVVSAAAEQAAAAAAAAPQALRSPMAAAGPASGHHSGQQQQQQALAPQASHPHAGPVPAAAAGSASAASSAPAPVTTTTTATAGLASASRVSHGKGRWRPSTGATKAQATAVTKAQMYAAGKSPAKGVSMQPSSWSEALRLIQESKQPRPVKVVSRKPKGGQCKDETGGKTLLLQQGGDKQAAAPCASLPAAPPSQQQQQQPSAEVVAPPPGLVTAPPASQPLRRYWEALAACKPPPLQTAPAAAAAATSAAGGVPACPSSAAEPQAGLGEARDSAASTGTCTDALGARAGLASAPAEMLAVGCQAPAAGAGATKRSRSALPSASLGVRIIPAHQ